MKCKFCENLKDAVERQKSFAQRNPTRNAGYMDEYVAAFVHKSSYKGEPCGKLVSSDYPLNFCPECGKKINIKQ